MLELSPDEKRTLLRLAREAIACKLHGKPPELPDRLSGTLQADCGAFVTLHKDGNLRGCIGYIQAFKPLYETVMEMAISAAFADPRFQPVEESELDDIEIEISVLSPLEKIESPDQVIVGKHGLYMKRGAYSGLLLPQVPVEHDWDRQTFIAHTCLKAGLPAGSEKDPETELYVFTAEVFCEKDFPDL